MVKVSVIVLCYNSESVISRCLDSLAHQTLDNVEVIIVNDGSTDGSLHIINSKISEFGVNHYATVINLGQNHGQAYCRIKGIKAAKGEYVIACDADDYMAPQMLETLYTKAKIDVIDIVSCDFYRVFNSKSMIDAQPVSNNPVEYIKLILLAQKWGGVWNHLIKRTLLDDVRPPETSIMEDTNILVQCLLRAKSVAHIPHPLYYYTNQDNSTTSLPATLQGLKKQATSMNSNVLAIETYLNDMGISDTKYHIMYRKFFNKRWLNPAIKTVNDCKDWINLNSDINLKLFFNPYISLHDKIVSLLILSRIYPLIKKFI